MKILFKFPTMARSELFKKVLDRYYLMLSGKYEYRFLMTLNQDDVTMNNEDMRFYMDACPDLEYKFGDHETKIEACNADMEGEDFDILFLISDDMIPVVKNFDRQIVRAMKRYFPKMDGALHYHDGFYGKDKTITLSIMGKKLYDYFGYIYHPDYKSFFCDNEFTDEVRRLKKVKYFPEIIVRHNWKGGPRSKCALYRRNSKMGKGDGAVYERRKKLGFPREV